LGPPSFSGPTRRMVRKTGQHYMRLPPDQAAGKHRAVAVAGRKPGFLKPGAARRTRPTPRRTRTGMTNCGRAATKTPTRSNGLVRAHMQNEPEPQRLLALTARCLSESDRAEVNTPHHLALAEASRLLGDTNGIQGHYSEGEIPHGLVHARGWTRS